MDMHGCMYIYIHIYRSGGSTLGVVRPSQFFRLLAISDF